MDYSDLADIDQELENLGSVPANLSRIVARYGGWGLELDEVDETLETLDGSATLGEYPASGENESVEFGEVEPVSEVQDEPEAEVITDDPFEVFQDDVDDSVAQNVFVEAESHGLIQQASEPPEVSVSDEAPSEDEPEQVEYSAVLPEELTPIDEDVLDLRVAAESDRHSFAEFVDESSQEFIASSDQTTREDGAEQAPPAHREFDAVYFHDSEEDLPATEELRAFRDSDFDRYSDEAALTFERPSQERIQERSPFRDSEYKRLLELELDPSDFPQSEPTSGPPAADDLAEEAEFEALDDDDIVEIEDDDIEIGDQTEGATATEDDAEVQGEIVEVNEDDSRH